jgi:D-aspartate ligase
MSGALAVRCGVDFPRMTYRHLVDGTVPAPRTGTAGVYWINEGTDPRVARLRWRRGELPLRTGLVPYTSPHVFAKFALHDPGPVLAGVAARVGRRWSRLTERLAT